MAEAVEQIQPAADQAAFLGAATARRAAVLANAITGIYGLSGAGKTSLIATAAEYCWETFGKTMLYYSSDLGGWGTKLLSLIRLGIVRAYYVRNHVDPFETIELITMGAFPATLLDPETGLADPNVPLILPRRMVFRMYCPERHQAAQFEHEVDTLTANVICPTCQKLTNVGTASKVERVIVQSRGFERVGTRAYDSFTQLNDWGMDDLQKLSALGLLPTNSGGGSVLAGADALKSGELTFSTSSKGQYGFLQNRSYGWMANIRAIPGHVVSPIATFGVEQGKGDDESGGVPVFGPKIAGNARTSSVPGWVGNCCHANREPNADGNMVYRLWLVNHYDSNDPRRIPYLSKHRGEPWGMPNYLEDPWNEDKATRDAGAWSNCSLAVLFKLLDQQLQRIEARDQARFKDTPGMQTSLEGDVVAKAIAADVAAGIAPPPEQEIARVVEPEAGPQPTANIIRRARGRGIRPVSSPGEAGAPTVPVGEVIPPTAAAVPSTGPYLVGAPASPIAEQLKATLAQAAPTDLPSVIANAAQASLEAAGSNGNAGTVSPAAGAAAVQGLPSPAVAAPVPSAVAAAVAAAAVPERLAVEAGQTPMPSASMPPPGPVTLARPIRRVPRPPA